ncbi:GTP diphosphokinase [Avibacterium paragallinarum]|uniref:GTP diphosphokinase n=1 Tax=Avibacterium paragallinarum TaxID=728 RepID=UPI00021ACFF9|nr:GTP diphosphokinase [Avibacterium paragallinarum]AZI13463.1 GTP diphosphokinase [Avibacterium paragallinarum]QJE08836.1 GTP diphosphokinase [Avibacterium paragallinarum]QJE11033.1 GTP diphosphokinase [Avibacterium paragallinarum]QJE13230.1 GTP diphosphokinase [Avibacterium paragallinarum]QJE15431.1 GTP diphosphokinase [Avibacterium paragallinarum]
MVAVRGSHLLNPKDFVIEQWSESLKLSPDLAQKLVQTWHYSQEKIQQNQNLAENSQWHCSLSSGVEMAEILHSLNMDSESLITAMIYPVVSHNIVALEQISEDFGTEISKLVKGVMEMDNIRQLNASHSANALQVDNVRRMLLAMVDDFRCVIIKLAERIAFLRDAENCCSEEEKVLAAKECSNIYAPLANRLGIGQLKWELEDYCFRYLHPEQYRMIAKLLKERRLDREQYIADFVAELTQYLQESIKQVEVYGRPKHIYSIWRKMQKKHLEFSDLYDVRAVRVIVQKLQDCYSALGIVHTHFKHLPKEFDDYVANPKPNGYQSIHTVVLGKGGKPIEVQIRTQQMHDDAELGVAAHWKYKEGVTGRSAYEDKIAWLRKLLAWQDDITDSGEVIAELRSQVFDDRVYVFTPKGEVIDLPTGSTPLDFAYAIHSEIGHRCIGAKVGGRIVPFTYQLQMGDQIEIITQKTPNPSRDWLNPNLGFTNTSKARAKIAAWFKKLDRDKNIPAGKELLENEIARLGITLKQVEQYALPRYNLKNVEDLYAGIGGGDIRVNQLINFLQSKLIKTSPQETDEQILRHVAQKSAVNSQHKNESKDYVIVEGVGNLMHHIARCCQPIPGDDIVGYITMGRGISIHRSDCEQFLELQNSHPERVVESIWGESYANGFRIGIRIIASDRHGLLRDITTVLANEKISVLGVSSRTDIKKQIATMDMDIELNNVQMLSKILARLAKLDDVIEAKRL